MYGGKLYALSLAGTLTLYDVATFEMLRQVQLDGLGPHRSVVVLNANRILTGSGDGRVRIFDGDLKPVASLELLRRGYVWCTKPEEGHPGWLLTDRQDMIDVGERDQDMLKPWTETDPRRARHLAIYNSASHVMQLVTGTSPTYASSLLSFRGPAVLAGAAHRLTFVLGRSDADR